MIGDAVRGQGAAGTATGPVRDAISVHLDAAIEGVVTQRTTDSGG